MRPRSSQIVLWVAAAIAGIVLAVSLTTVASRLSSQHVGLSSEPLTAGRSLAPRPSPPSESQPRPRPTPHASPTRSPAPSATPTAVATPTVSAAPPTRGGEGDD